MIRVARSHGDNVVRLTLAAGKGNVLDLRAIGELREAAQGARAVAEARCILLDAEGPHFSFGASVEEHRPEQVGAMLPAFHGLLAELLSLPVPLLVAIRGQCLGGGIEVALTGSRLFAHPSARLGQPELKLGVFAPAGSALLPSRVGQAAAEELLLSGRTVPAAEAHAMGLVDDVAKEEDDPSERALAYAREALFPRSPTSLRIAHRAARAPFVAQAIERIRVLERVYLDELMSTPDAREGIAAFLEKRPPRWKGGEVR